MVQISDFRSFVLADLPGIIEGAHEGKGLGHQFLRHIERTRTLAVFVPVDVEDAQAEYDALRAELEAYSQELAATPHCLVLTKIDLLGPDGDPPEVDAPGAWGRFAVSSVTRTGVPELLEALWKNSRPAEPEQSDEDGDEEWWTP